MNELKWLEQVATAKFLATVAHTAKGQTRADKVTPYIVHPKRVNELCSKWQSEGVYKEKFDVYIACAAAWLHDVVEDTRVTLENLNYWGINYDVVHRVDLLTKKNLAHEPESESYFIDIASDDIAIVVKCADICANLEDIATDATKGIKPTKDWRRYVAAKREKALPMYKLFPFLRGEFVKRLEECERIFAENPEVPRDASSWYCHASGPSSRAFGDCGWEKCPQTRDGEPDRSGRHCPLPSTIKKAHEPMPESEQYLSENATEAARKAFGEVLVKKKHLCPENGGCKAADCNGGEDA